MRRPYRMAWLILIAALLPHCKKNDAPQSTGASETEQGSGEGDKSSASVEPHVEEGDDEFVTATEPNSISGANLTNDPPFEVQVVDVVNGTPVTLSATEYHVLKAGALRAVVPPTANGPGESTAVGIVLDRASTSGARLFARFLTNPAARPLLVERTLDFAALMQLAGTVAKAETRANQAFSGGVYDSLALDFLASNLSEVAKLAQSGKSVQEVAASMQASLKDKLKPQDVTTQFQNKTYDWREFGIAAATGGAGVVGGIFAAAGGKSDKLALYDKLAREFLCLEKLDALAEVTAGLDASVRDRLENAMWEIWKDVPLGDLGKVLLGGEDVAEAEQLVQQLKSAKGDKAGILSVIEQREQGKGTDTKTSTQTATTTATGTGTGTSTSTDGSDDTDGTDDTDGGNPPAGPDEMDAVILVAGKGQVDVQWIAYPGATSYVLYYGAESPVSTNGIQKAGLTGTSTQVGGLSPGTTYYFAIKALLAGGATPLSDERSVKVKGWASDSVATDIEPQDPSALAIGSDGHGFLAWATTGDEVKVAPVVDGKVGTPYVIGTSPVPGAANLRLDVSGGEAVLAWSDATNLRAARFRNGSWGSVATIGTVGSEVKVLMDPPYAVVVWAESGGTVKGAIDNTGAGFSPFATDMSDVGNSVWDGSLQLVKGGGKYVAAWAHLDGDVHAHAFAANAAGLDVDMSSGANNASMRLTGGDVATLAWINATGDLITREYAGNSWTSELTLVAGTVVAATMQLSSQGSRTVVAWHDSAGSIKALIKNNSAWLPSPEVIGAPGANGSQTARIAMSPEKDVLVAHLSVGDEVRARVYREGTGWETAETLGFSMLSSLNLAPAIGADGLAGVMWRASAPEAAVAKERKNNVWTSVGTLESGGSQPYFMKTVVANGVVLYSATIDSALQLGASY